MTSASKYSRKKIIGRTPSGLVYRGQNTQLGSEVVIKELGEELRRDACREAITKLTEFAKANPNFDATAMMAAYRKRLAQLESSLRDGE